MKILLLGKTGQLGQALLPHLKGIGTVTPLGRQELDLAHPETIPATIAHHQPQVIVNAAAYTAVDRAESEPELAQAINGDGPGQLAAAAAQVGAQLIHCSTDYVFPGTQGTPWRETDTPAPLGTYGRTKLAGEQGIQRALPHRHVIIRTAWVYGTLGPGNFVKTMVRLGQTRETLRVVQDQIGSPTWTEDLAQAIATLITLGEQVSPGLYHYTNSGVASWYDFAVAILEEAQALNIPLMATQVQPIPTTDYPTPAPRPAYSVLDCGKMTALLGTSAPHWRTSLRAMLRQYRDQIPAIP